jgi:UDP-glucose 4-epimerase
MEHFKKSSILVTGGAGFVGGNLVRRLLKMEVENVLIVDNLLSAEKVNIPDDPRVRFIEGSIAHDKVLDDIHDEFDIIFHLSTYHGNQSSMANPLVDHENNLLTTIKLLERVKTFKRLHKWVYSAAGCAVAEKTFDEAHATMEDAPISIKMDSPYSISKIVGEFYAVYYHERHGIPTVRARFQNVYGPGEILGAGRWRGTPATVWRNVVPTFVYKSLHGEALPLENAGESTRDFIFVEDLIEGLLLCAVRGAPGEVYNLASGVETSIRELAQIINKYTGNTTPPTIKPARDWDHSGRRFGSPLKSKRDLGFTSAISITEGLQKTINWSRQNAPLIESCIRKHDKPMREYAGTG